MNIKNKFFINFKISGFFSHDILLTARKLLKDIFSVSLLIFLFGVQNKLLMGFLGLSMI